MKPLHRVRGTVEHIVFRSDDETFSIFRAWCGEEGLVSVAGRGGKLLEGDEVECEGEWEEHRVHGRQFRAQRIMVRPPTRPDGLARLLAGERFKGIGPVLAERLAKQFGSDLDRVVREEPKRLAGVQGLGEQAAASLVEQWIAYHDDRKLEAATLPFLYGLGLGPQRAQEVFERYGEDTVSRLQRNPYRLIADVHGFGFRRADAAARELGLDPASNMRVRAALWDIVRRRTEIGDCAVRREELVAEARTLLGLDDSHVTAGLGHMLEEDKLVQVDSDGEFLVYPPRLYQAEQEVADHLKALRQGNPPWASRFDVEKAQAQAAGAMGTSLSPSQASALQTLLTSKISIVTGGPGTGKTMLLGHFLAALPPKTRVLLGAPTGMAAERLTLAAGREARTIHRLLEYHPEVGFRRNAGDPLEADLICIDETSMLDIPLLQALLEAIPEAAAVAFIGDADQLPSVGPGRVLGDLIDSGALPCAALTEIFRQAQSSGIVVAAHQIRTGELPHPAIQGEFRLELLDNATQIEARLRDLVSVEFPAAGIDVMADVQVLSPMRKGMLGTRQLNEGLRTLLNPRVPEAVEYGSARFAPADRVIQTRNDYDKGVFNGQQGVVNQVESDGPTVTVEFSDRALTYKGKELNALDLAYALTVHKSQGSEYPVVILLAAREHYVVADRRLVFTGITRSRSQVVVLSENNALATMIHKADGVRRITRLAQLLGQFARCGR